jgi:hypothetical protein
MKQNIFPISSTNSSKSDLFFFSWRSKLSDKIKTRMTKQTLKASLESSLEMYSSLLLMDSIHSLPRKNSMSQAA